MQDWNLAQGTCSLFTCDGFPPFSLAWEQAFCSAGLPDVIFKVKSSPQHPVYTDAFISLCK